MKIELNSQDLIGAPDSVLQWLCSRIGQRSHNNVVLRSDGPRVKELLTEDPPPPVDIEAFGATPEEVAQLHSEVEEVATVPTAGEPITMEGLLQKCSDWLQGGGGSTDLLKEALQSMGLTRVKECPPDKMGELLSLLAIS